MATLSFTASNGKRYSLLSLPDKLTTPSLKVGSSYVPCFVGSAESDVTSGEYVYTLSPMKVGDTHAAYKRRFAFEKIGHVYIQVQVCGLWHKKADYFKHYHFSGSFQRIYTDTDGYTASATITSTNQGDVQTYYETSKYYYWNGTYTVTHDDTGETVDSGTFSVGATAYFGAEYIQNCQSPTFTIK